MLYIIIKVINNNVVHAKDNTNSEYILMGKGIGYQQKINNSLDVEQVEKKFSLNNDDKFNTMLKEIDPKIIEITYDLVSYVQDELNIVLADTFALSLIDHIDFALKRYKDGIVIKSPLACEVNRFYVNEVKLAKVMISVLNSRLSITLPEDEVAMFALHIVNAQSNVNIMDETFKITEISNDIIDIVRYCYKKEFDDTEFHFNRFLMHLSFFVRRHLKVCSAEFKHSTMFDIAAISYPNALTCVENISDYLIKTHDWYINDDEKLYLLIHIEKFTS